jgi:hypothetical protein
MSKKIKGPKAYREGWKAGENAKARVGNPYSENARQGRIEWFTGYDDYLTNRSIAIADVQWTSDHTTAESCKAKAKQIRKAAAHLSDPEAVVGAFEMASRWDEKAVQIAVRDI